jgi:site-specific DNA-methyltransferase (adenine-specific)
VLKPGGYLLAFGGSRTYHRIACAIEDAGFEIRDCIMWLYGSGFPKNMNIGLAIDKKNGVKSKTVGSGRCGKTAMLGGLRDMDTNDGNYEIKEAQNEWAGWGTALKPSYEPIVVARKPLDGSCVANVMKWDVGGLNIDECRIETSDKVMTHSKTSAAAKSKGVYGDYGAVTTHQTESQKLGRFPANTILDTQDGEEWRRYFYCAKASKNDRDEGLEEFSTKTSGQMTERKEGSAGITAFTGSRSPKKNNHPTVKPTELMRYLVRLVTPKGGTVLDPFMGSGSTGKAVACENNERNAEYKFIGIEKETEYCKIAEARIKYVEQSEQQQRLI